MLRLSRPLLSGSKYISNSLGKRKPMSSKDGNKNYYKGVKGMTKEGRHTSKGKYISSAHKKLTIVPPPAGDAAFGLKPYVSPWVLKERRREYDPEA
mmetsp:Transcript_580/g.1040  ORF Transcript_580/g.1040 Transcript_580/m.1040 type:complete len:96 (+) Transcript_580:45-332(+)